MNVWPQFRSPLLWDVFAVSTYATISVVFWYIGMIPDFGTFRDRAQSKLAQYFYGMLSWGWRGSVRHWMRYETASLLLAGLATPLVLSVHTVISFDFAVAVLPGWHTTIFPPYFVAGAIYSGFAMVLTLAIPLRKFYHLEAPRHRAPHRQHGQGHARHRLHRRLRLRHGSLHGLVLGFALGSLHVLESRVRSHGLGLLGADRLQPGHSADHALVAQAAHQSIAYMFFISIVVNTGMWFERFVIVVTSLYRDFLPSSWGTYRATKWDYMTFIGTLGLFTTLFLLFVRFLPMIPMNEIRMILPAAKIKPKSDSGSVTKMPSREGTYGLLAEFDTPSDLVRAARQAREDGWRRMDCYTPYPVEEAAEAIGFHRNRVPLVTLIGGLMGLAAMFSHGDLDLGHRLSAQHRRAPALLLARVHRARV